MIWDRKYETLSREELQRLQLARLKEQVARVYEKVPYYRRCMEEAGVRPEDIRSLDDLARLPFTTKDDLRQNYPFGLFAVPLDRVIRIHASSGTTGKPTVVGYTKKDLRTWAGLIARIVTMAGVRRGDIAQVCFSYGLFTGGFGLHYGLERAGVTVVPAAAGNTERHIRLMQDFGTTVIVGTPSYALYMAEVARSLGVDPRRDLRVRRGLFGAEPWSEGMRAEIEAAWGIKAFDNYGLSEVIGPGVAGECEEKRGLHINEDHFLVEVIDPETGRPLPPGERGELVFTTLTKEAFPVIRYRTRDISRLMFEPCPCGRTTIRMERVTGRSDDMLIIRGVNVFPSQIEEVITSTPGLAPHYLIIVDKKGYLDEIEVQVELSPEGFSDRYEDLASLEEQLRNRLQATLSLTPRVKLVEFGSLERTTGKARRVIDRRKEAAK
ncbi:phenylacetate--CoA ligase family protein [Thermodesulfitimonas autotrophica]|uniref:phenylacetate--CoA ligase family protein n=1 Tax=Thermodesulfitimonas autotrophica TaxID=1894989 RepID=UPI000F4E6D84|nr:phenylacetate--CoA ligase [Thermodesulfitimonas autotrophica]